MQKVYITPSLTQINQRKIQLWWIRYLTKYINSYVYLWHSSVFILDSRCTGWLYITGHILILNKYTNKHRKNMGMVSHDNGFMVIANLKQLLLEQLIKVIVTLIFYKYTKSFPRTLHGLLAHCVVWIQPHDKCFWALQKLCFQ